MRRKYTIIFSYIGKEFILSFIVAFLFFFFIFFVNQMLLLAEDVLSKHVPFKDVLLLIIYSLPLIVSLAFPFGSLVGALMAVGRFSSDNEILAFQASGVARRKLFFPIFLVGILFSVFSFFINDYFLPKGTINFNKLFRKLLYSNPEMELEPYSVKRYQDSILITGDVSGNRIDGLTIIDKDPDDNRRMIMAKSAVLGESTEQQGVISLELTDVFSHIADGKRVTRAEYLISRKMIYNILLKDISFSVRNPGPSEMSSRDVYSTIQEKRTAVNDKIAQNERLLREYRYNIRLNYMISISDADGIDEKTAAELSRQLEEVEKLENKQFYDRSLHLYRLEFHKKIAVPIACFIFVIFAFPIGLFTKRSGRSVGFGIGLLIAVIYWGMLFAGQTFGLRARISPILSMWAPNIVIIVMGLTGFLVRGRK